MNNTKRMLGLGIAAAALAAGVLVWTAKASNGNPVERSFKIKADVVLVVNLADGTTVGGSQGEVSGVGRFVVHATGVMDLASGAFQGNGFAKSEDGLIFFTMPNGGWVEFQGGTGLFEKVTGGHTLVPTATPAQSVVDGKLIISYSYTGEGTMTY